MAEIGFFAITCALLIFIVVLEVIHVRERRTMMNTIISRTPAEARMLNQDLDRSVLRTPRSFEEPELTPEEREFWAHGDPVGM